MEALNWPRPPTTGLHVGAARVVSRWWTLRSSSLARPLMAINRQIAPASPVSNNSSDVDDEREYVFFFIYMHHVTTTIINFEKKKTLCHFY